MTVSPLVTKSVPSSHSANILRIAAIYVVHSGECDLTVPAENLAAYFATNDEGTGPHYVVDGENVVFQIDESLAAMACGPNGNPISTQTEQPGRAAYTRDQWLSNGTQQFTNMGLLFADWADRRGIPKRRATNADVQYFHNGGTDLSRGGYVDHNQITQAIGGTTHWDVGDSYPWDLFEAAWSKPDPKPVPVPPTPDPNFLEWLMSLPGAPSTYDQVKKDFANEVGKLMNQVWDDRTSVPHGLDVVINRLNHAQNYDGSKRGK